jgi:hypothetical protein
MKITSTKVTTNYTITLDEDEAYILLRIMGNMPTIKAVGYANAESPFPPKRELTLKEVSDVTSAIYDELDRDFNPQDYYENE